VLAGGDLASAGHDDRPLEDALANPTGPSVPVSAFGLEEADGHEALTRVLEADSGTVAVTVPPYAGRDSVLADLADRLGAAVERCDPDRAVAPGGSTAASADRRE